MLHKRGQITLFIITGAVLFVLFGLLMWYTSSVQPEASKAKASDITPVRNYVESCIESVGNDALMWIGQHGGYYELPAKSSAEYAINAPYYFYEGANLMPAQEMLEAELSKYMDAELSFCLKDFTEFTEQNMHVISGDVSSTAKIEQDSVLFEVTLPLQIGKDSSDTAILLFSKRVGSGLNRIYAFYSEFIRSQMLDAGSVCLSCLYNLSVQNELTASITRLDNDTLLFKITAYDNKKDPYLFYFAAKYEHFTCTDPPYTWREKELNEFMSQCIERKIDEEHYELRLQHIPNLEANASFLFEYLVKAAGSGITFHDTTALFDINKTTGLISFIPDKQGSHLIWIYAEDNLGNEDFDSFNLTIR